MFCSCTLSGTTACKYCNNNTEALMFNKDGQTVIITTNVPKSAVKPLLQYWCPECEALINKYDKYCHNCAVELDWEGVE